MCPHSRLYLYRNFRSDFLRELHFTGCKNVIITGGNHDSISTLNAPKELLKYFNIHVIGGVPENLLVPFEAIKSFFDPSIQFGLQFETIAEASP